MYIQPSLRRTAIACALASGVAALTLPALTPAPAAGAPTCLGREATIVGGDRDTVVGTPGDDVIWVGDTATEVRGGLGHDRICAGASTERIVGGRGDDRIRMDAGGPDGVEVVTGKGNDQVLAGAITPGATVSLGGGVNVVRVATWAPRVELIAGGPYIDILYTGAADDRVDLARGTLRPGDGPTVKVRGFWELVTQGGDDVVVGNGRTQVVSSGPGDDVLKLRGAHDRGYGGAGADVIRGGGGVDQLVGDGGRDRVFGGAGSDDQCEGEVKRGCESVVP